jgi:hypothetical protein
MTDCDTSSELRRQCQTLETLAQNILKNQEIQIQVQKPYLTEQLPAPEVIIPPSDPTPSDILTCLPTAPVLGDSGEQLNDTSTVEPTLQDILEERRTVAAAILGALAVKSNLPLSFLGKMGKRPPVPFSEHPGLPSLFEESVEEYDGICRDFGWKSPHCPHFWLSKAAWWLLKVPSIRVGWLIITNLQSHAKSGVYSKGNHQQITHGCLKHTWIFGKPPGWFTKRL